mmetsp:Transcript_43054/g.115118  ORF Transcript_43054/g.115118 Transcript_43054/m.115118 type:complete len:91 (+) Transcript_43054:65-337(+)
MPFASENDEPTSSDDEYVEEQAVSNEDSDPDVDDDLQDVAPDEDPTEMVTVQKVERRHDGFIGCSNGNSTGISVCRAFEQQRNGSFKVKS